MSFCTDKNSILAIDSSECVGNSLVTINTNFEILKDEICLQDENIQILETEKETLTTYVSTLSSQLKTLPRCIAKFDGEGSVVDSKGINVVLKISDGVYYVSFTTPFDGVGYVVIGSTISEIPNFVFVSAETQSYVLVNTRNSLGDLVNPDFINLIFFS